MPSRQALSAAFAARFGPGGALFAVRAPGRVNLIGEHVDYNDLPVLPMAIQRATTLVVRARDDGRVRLANSDARFEPREFELARDIEPARRGDWSNYVRAAAQLLARELDAARGADLYVSGDIPPAAGLSSSSALVVASGLALATVNGLPIDALDFAERMARAERYVGAHSGGMDQAICLLGRADHAVRIEFAPLRVEPLPCPADWRFLIANSLVEADKSGAARERYNARRADCEWALKALLASPGFQGAPASYRGLLERFDPSSLVALAAATLDGAPLARFRHQVTEFARVARARNCLLAADADGFGVAMNESHASLRDDYEVSCPQLDALVDAAREAGAVGARLTGAGFGGCIVALVRDSLVERVRESLLRRFYARSAPLQRDALLLAVASDGARVETF